jgi:hypothetical protein
MCVCVSALAAVPSMGSMWLRWCLCLQGRTEVVLELLERGAILEDPDDEGMRPLMHAAAGGDVACLRAMLSRSPGPHVEAADERGRTAALHAAAAGQVEALKVRLLDAVTAAISYNSHSWFWEKLDVVCVFFACVCVRVCVCCMCPRNECFGGFIDVD